MAESSISTREVVPRGILYFCLKQNHESFQRIRCSVEVCFLFCFVFSGSFGACPGSGDGTVFDQSISGPLQMSMK